MRRVLGPRSLGPLEALHASSTTQQHAADAEHIDSPMRERTPVVVFDFDLTLTRWDTADRFFRWLLRRDLWRLAMVLAAAPLLGPLLLVASTRKWPIHFAVWAATIGRTPACLSALAEEHIGLLATPHESVFVPAALQCLHAHLAEGHHVVIATGCLEPLAQALLRHVGLDSVPLVASTLRPFLGGLASDQHCFGPNKVSMLTARGFAPPWAITYTDHRADLPILALSAKRYLISPTPKCRARIEEALATEIDILMWR